MTYSKLRLEKVNQSKIKKETKYDLIKNTRNLNNYIEYESNGDKDKNLSIEEYLNKVEPYSKDIIIDLQKPDIWKNQLTIVINFISSKDTNKE